MKAFCLIRRWRGTKFGLMNLIRTFGQDTKSLYTKADLRGVEVIEYGSGGPETIEPNMYPGDIKISIPELSTILRDSIYDTKLAGTRLTFSYYIFMGVFHMKMFEDYAYLIKYWIRYIGQNYDPVLKWYGSRYLDTPLSSCKSDQVSHRTFKGKPIASCQLLTYYREPWNDGFILNVPGLTNYRGFIEESPEIVGEHILYK